MIEWFAPRACFFGKNKYLAKLGAG
jgi:hypothetical protein